MNGIMAKKALDLNSINRTERIKKLMYFRTLIFSSLFLYISTILQTSSTAIPAKGTSFHIVTANTALNGIKAKKMIESTTCFTLRHFSILTISLTAAPLHRAINVI